ncbi:MAG: sialate O-acetylesterase [Candidatus Symbiothrix sp.]|nr:sialate O-acetylesterase [Candidatus Symbiothrix sp.]
MSRAEIRLPQVFTDNMVLQRQTDAPIWGKAAPNSEVTIAPSWDSLIFRVPTNGNGQWTTKIKTPDAGGPYTIAIACNDETVTLKNVLIGEVWICSGQSNMEMPLAGWGKVQNYEYEIAAASFPKIRLLQVNKNTSAIPLSDLASTAGGWQECSPASIPEFSAVAYFFGRHLYEHLSVPIGLINTSWGGTIAEAWTSRESLMQMPEFVGQMEDVISKPETDDVKGNPNRPTVLYNAMIRPLAPFAIRGAIWYQGESNADRATQYRDLLPLMIRDWRKTWDNEFPFYFVQLANYMKRQTEPQESRWAELREAQLRTLRLNNTGMAVAIDIGDADDIHPKNKQTVGERLALNARALTYEEPIPYSGPIYRSYNIEDNRIRIVFGRAVDGLRTNDGKDLRGFAIAGPDHIFHWAKATMADENELIVYAPEVKFPVAVRYAWADNPDCNLCDGTGLPASPFRTDDWQK